MSAMQLMDFTSFESFLSLFVWLYNEKLDEKYGLLFNCLSTLSQKTLLKVFFVSTKFYQNTLFIDFLRKRSFYAIGDLFCSVSF